MLPVARTERLVMSFVGLKLEEGDRRCDEQEHQITAEDHWVCSEIKIIDEALINTIIYKQFTNYKQT